MINSTEKKQKTYTLIKFSIVICSLLLFILLFSTTTYAQSGISIDLTTASEGENSLGNLEILVLLLSISLLPSMILLMSCFTRIVIVLSFMRTALGTQQAPPNMVLIGLALFLTLFIMQPILQEIDEVAYQPYLENEIDSMEALEAAQEPIKRFMLMQTNPSDLNLFLEISNSPLPEGFDISSNESKLELGLEVLVPSFVTSELKRAFTIGFLLFIPFLVIDLVVASTLMSMGMMMLPPAMISLPFKLLVFVLVDGWGLLLEMLANSFNM